MILDEWRQLIKEKNIDIVVLDMPLLNIKKYKDLDGIESLISGLILQLLSYMAEDEREKDKSATRGRNSSCCSEWSEVRQKEDRE